MEKHERVPNYEEIDLHNKELNCLVEALPSKINVVPDKVEKIFEKFYRVDNRLTRATSGVGLGLHICKGIVERHGGHIWAESKIGEGSTLYFSLPTDQLAGSENESPSHRRGRIYRLPPR